MLEGEGFQECGWWLRVPYGHLVPSLWGGDWTDSNAICPALGLGAAVLGVWRHGEDIAKSRGAELPSLELLELWWVLSFSLWLPCSVLVSLDSPAIVSSPPPYLVLLVCLNMCVHGPCVCPCRRAWACRLP